MPRGLAIAIGLIWPVSIIPKIQSPKNENIFSLARSQLAHTKMQNVKDIKNEYLRILEVWGIIAIFGVKFCSQIVMPITIDISQV